MGKLAQATAKAVEERAVQGCPIGRLAQGLPKQDRGELFDLIDKTRQEVPYHARLSTRAAADIILDVYPDSMIVESTIAAHRTRKCSCPKAAS
jgi:hypothetical protein